MSVRDVSDWALQPGAGKCTCTGSVVLTRLDRTKLVIFPHYMSNSNYVVLFERSSGTQSVIWPSDKTVQGFTMNVSVPLDEVVRYLVVED